MAAEGIDLPDECANDASNIGGSDTSSAEAVLLGVYSANSRILNSLPNQAVCAVHETATEVSGPMR